MKQWSSIRPTKKKDEGTLPAGATPPALLTFFDLTAIGLGSSLAFGISVLTGHLLKSVTGPAVVVSISLAGFTAFVGGLCFAEVGVRFVKVDSVYPYCYLWSKENAAFIFGWLLILEYVAGAASGAKGVIAFLDALSEHQIFNFLEGVASLSPNYPFRYFDFLSFGIIAIVTALIVFGMKESLIIKRIFTMCNITLLIFIIIAGALKADEKNWNPEGTTDGQFGGGFTPFGALGVVKGAAIAFYGFIGFDTVSITGNEVKRQNRNLPLAITSTVLFTLLAYAGVAVVLTLMLPYHKHDPHAVIPFAFQQLGWTALKWTVAAATFLGFQTSMFGVIFPLPRILYAMANDGLLFHCLGNCQSRLRIPVAASVTGGLVAATAAAFIPFENLVNLTVMGALLVLTILAINVILLRYSLKLEVEERMTESWPPLINSNLKISAKAVLHNYFNFTAKNPTNITEKIILINLILFCLSSIGLGLIFNLFNGALMEKTAEAIIPAGILLCILLLNVISITCQPKSQESAIFKVPLVPLIPCLSIFLNIFFLLTFESTTWILFFCWMAAGIIPYSIWRCLKCFKEEIGENSLYEINKSNAVKLCESIWKIKSDKKSFYEGAVNPVFSDEMDEPNVINNDPNNVDRWSQIDAIQKAEAVEEEKPKSAGSELQLNFVYASDAEIETNFPGDDKVQWECVAEIHTEDEFLQESNVLELVDNTYDFLTELSRDDAPGSYDESKEKNEPLTVSKEGSLPEADMPENVPESRDESKQKNEPLTTSKEGSVPVADMSENSPENCVESKEKNQPLTASKENSLPEGDMSEKAPGSYDESKKKYEPLTASKEGSPPQVDTAENAVLESGNVSENSAQFSDTKPIPEKLEHQKRNGYLLLKEELLKKVKEGEGNKTNGTKEYSNPLNAKETSTKGYDEELLKQNSLDDSPYAKSPFPDSSDQKERRAEKAPEEKRIDKDNLAESPESQEAASIPDQKNRIKQFKERLNQLLKNQVIGGAIATDKLRNSRANVELKSDSDANLDDEKEKNNLTLNIKTLNKSQIRSKLELLLTKGPPKRASLGSSFSIKEKVSNEESELQKSEGMVPNNQEVQMINDEDEEKTEKSSPEMQTKSETLVSLENNKLQNDVCC